jgi:transcriptional regulator with XRE-family HTH domain
MLVDKELDRILTLLRNKIREKGFTQLEVQETLGWGRSYISQLLTKQKSLRVEQVLLILNVIGVDPADFFAELYHIPTLESGPRNVERFPVAVGERMPLGREGRFSDELLTGEFLRSFKEVKAMMRGLVETLITKQLISVEDLSEAVKGDDSENGGSKILPT